MLISFQCRSLIKKCFLATMGGPRPLIMLRHLHKTLSPIFFSANLYLGLSFGFLHLHRPNNIIHEAAIFFFFCHFDANAFLKDRTPCLHLHALRIDLGMRKCKHPSPDFSRSQFIIARMHSSFVFPDNVSSFCHWGSKTFCFFPANLATQRNITRIKQCFRNNVS